MCIFAYGQTGSGKTHTMLGTHVEHLEGRGINYRALDDLFALNESRQAEVCSRPLPQIGLVCFLFCSRGKSTVVTTFLPERRVPCGWGLSVRLLLPVSRSSKYGLCTLESS